MSAWLSSFGSSLHRQAEPPYFLGDDVGEDESKSKRVRAANNTFSKVIAADHDSTWQQTRQEQLDAV